MLWLMLSDSLFNKMKQDKKSEARFILFHFIKKRSFNLLCVFGSFFRTLAVNSVSDCFKHSLGVKSSAPR